MITLAYLETYFYVSGLFSDAEATKRFPLQTAIAHSSFSFEWLGMGHRERIICCNTPCCIPMMQLS